MSVPVTFPPEFGVPAPPSAVLLGWSLRAMDAEAGTIEVGFEGRAAFANPAGFVQGGMLAAMIDDAIRPIVAAHTRRFPSTIDLHTHYLRPVRPGAVTVKARITQAGRGVVFLTAELFDSRGKLSATGSASARLTDGVFPQLEAGGPDA